MTMPITELAHLPLLPSSSSIPRGEEESGLTPAFLDAIRKVLKTQDAWCAENPTAGSPNKKPSARGVGLFVRVDDPLSLLLTAHWDSMAHHDEWIQSQANRDGLGLLASCLDMPRVSLFHVDDVEAFTGSEATAAEGETPTLSADYVSVSRFIVAADNKVDFERAWDKAGPVLREFVSPYVHRGGWRIEKEEGSGNKDEFVLIGGWDSPAREAEFVKSKGYAEYDKAMSTVLLGRDTKFYRRLL